MASQSRMPAFASSLIRRSVPEIKFVDVHHAALSDGCVGPCPHNSYQTDAEAFAAQ